MGGAKRNENHPSWCRRRFGEPCLADAGVGGRPHRITFPGDHAYPESLTATSDGTIYAGSLYEGGIFRVPPGATKAEQWIKPGANNSMITLGLIADEKAGTLWVCSSNLTGFGVKPPAGEKPVALKAFDLKTGAGKGSWPLPGEKTLCNDMVVGADGSVYVAESFQPHILKLAPGGTSLEVWATDPGFAAEGPGLDGITIGQDGNLYVNTFATGLLFRVEMGRAARRAGSRSSRRRRRALNIRMGCAPMGRTDCWWWRAPMPVVSISSRSTATTPRSRR